MITVHDIYDRIDRFAPFSSQLSFDNSGLLVGDPHKIVNKIGVCLDITCDTIHAASDLGADLIVSHHPVLFKPRKKLLSGDPAYLLASSGISAICAHTSLDAAVGGVNDVLADIFSLQRVEAVAMPSFPVPMVRVGFLSAPVRAMELAQLSADLLFAKVRWCDGGQSIETVAVCGGAGGDLVQDVASLGIDALITGDADYHDFLDAEQYGVTLIAAGHFETENPVVPVLVEKLRSAFPEIQVAVLPQKSTVKHM